MSCLVIRDHQSDLLEYCRGSFETERRLDIAKHAASCSECQTFIAQQQQVNALLDEWTLDPVSPEFDLALQAKLAQATSEGFGERLRRWLTPLWRPAIPVGAAAALAAVLITVQYPVPHAPSTAGETVDASRIDVNQVEQTLDDLDMLRQMAPSDGSSGAQEL